MYISIEIGAGRGLCPHGVYCFVFFTSLPDVPLACAVASLNCESAIGEYLLVYTALDIDAAVYIPVSEIGDLLHQSTNIMYGFIYKSLMYIIEMSSK